MRDGHLFFTFNPSISLFLFPFLFFFFSLFFSFLFLPFSFLSCFFSFYFVFFSFSIFLVPLQKKREAREAEAKKEAAEHKRKVR